MEVRNTNFYINDGLIMQGKQIDTSVAVKIALDHGWSSIKGEHIFMKPWYPLLITHRLQIADFWSIEARNTLLVREDLESRQPRQKTIIIFF